MKKISIFIASLLLSMVLVSCNTVEEKNIIPLPEKEVIEENKNVFILTILKNKFIVQRQM